MKGGVEKRAAFKALCAVVIFLCTSAGPAAAGPPFLTDDPEPTQTGHWEVYTFVSGTRLEASNTGQAGLDINYGATPDLQLTAVVPVDYESAGSTRFDPGDLELAAKLRFLHQSDDGFLPDVAVFPRLFVPTATGQFGGAGSSLLVPLWLEKDFGPWSWFGGAGEQFNFGAGQRNFGLFGIALQR